MKLWAFLRNIALLAALPTMAFGQNCATLSKANNMVPDQFCSPVQVNWDVTYVGVNNAGTLVQILFEWDDGSSETLTATESVAGTYTANVSHTYVSQDDRCNYHPLATLIVNGVLCTSSEQEQIVTIWDTDNENGGRVEAEPNVYPVCVGSSATMRFDDGTLFNCVPPQENDVPNENTRWIQWVYGTRNTMSSATPVSVEGYTGPWEWEGPVITLPGPVHGSTEQSLAITIAADNQIGEEFEVELRYWNYCNPYPGSDPEIDRSVIRIVDFPDATITPAGPFCEFNPVLNLTAATGGGTWSGSGIINASSGQFDPAVAGVGVHWIRYELSDGNNCSATDSVQISVRDAPDASISPVDPFCQGDPTINLMATPAAGSWSGTGIIDVNAGTFDPAVAGIGNHDIVYTTAPDAFGCTGIDSAVIAVASPPFAAFLTPDSAWCEQAGNISQAEILISGSASSSFDLVVDLRGTPDTLVNLSAGSFTLFLNNLPGLNEYVLRKIIEYHGSNACETDLNDVLIMEIFPLPDNTLQVSDDELCSPVDMVFQAVAGYPHYYWDYGDGLVEQSNSPYRFHSYQIPEPVNPGENMESELTFHYKLGITTEQGCSDTARGSLTIYQNPVADFFLSPETQYYPQSTVSLDNLSSPGPWSYLWDFGDGSSSPLEEPGQHVYASYGAFDVSLLTYSDYCRDSLTRPVLILPPPPVVAFNHGPSGCAPLDVTFTNRTEYADSYLWDFDDGTFSTEINPTHTFYQSRDHEVRLIAVGLGGTDTLTRIVEVEENPRALFGVYPTESNTLRQLFKFLNNSINAETYHWDFGDGNTSLEKEPSHTYQEEGFYSVMLVATSEHGCVDTLIQENLIRLTAGDGDTKLPTAFVWNGTGPTGGYWEEGTIDNTVFHPHMKNAVALQMIIYTRWGEKVYESNEVYKGWDGYLDSGELAVEGVYVYRVWVTYFSGLEEVLAGDVTFMH